MVMSKKPGSSLNPFILKPIIDNQCALEKFHGGLDPNLMSDMQEATSLRQFVNNVLSNRKLSTYARDLAIWLRLNLNDFEGILSMSEIRSKQRFPEIGEIKKSQLSKIVVDTEQIPDSHKELLEKCRILINDSQLTLYKYLTNDVSKKKVEFLFDFFYKSKIPEFNSAFLNFDSIVCWLIDYFYKNELISTASEFSEIASLYWSRDQVCAFARDALKMDKEHMENLSRMSLEDMINFINIHYYGDGHNNDSEYIDSWVIHFVRKKNVNFGKHSLEFPLFRNVSTRFIQTKHIHDYLYGDGYDPQGFLHALLELESFGYMRVTPLCNTQNDGIIKGLQHPSDKDCNIEIDVYSKGNFKSNKIGLSYYYHLQFNGLISMRDYSTNWSAINAEIIKQRESKKS